MSNTLSVLASILTVIVIGLLSAPWIYFAVNSYFMWCYRVMYRVKERRILKGYK